MKSVSCERLVFLTPSIQTLIAAPELQHFCISEIFVTRSYLRCCYISLQNFLFELLEVTDISQAQEFAFFTEAQDLAFTKLVGIGLRADNLDAALHNFQKNGIVPVDYYTSSNTEYSKGYKHRSASLNLRWFNTLVYASEYDPIYFQEREKVITQDAAKKQLFSVMAPLLLDSFLHPPPFLHIGEKTPELCVNLTLDSDSPLSKVNTLDCGWITLRW